MLRQFRSALAALAPFLALAATTVSLPLVMGFWGQFHPAFDSLAHFRVHLAALIVLLALPLVFVRGWRRIGLMGVVFGIAAVTTVTVPTGRAAGAGAEGGTGDYRLLQLNLRYDNATPEKVLSLIGRVRPDVVTLNEVSAAWRAPLERLTDAYPYRIVCPPPTPIGGVAILSRRPFAGPEPRCLDRGSLAIAGVDFGGRRVDIAALHLGWPWPHGQEGQIGRVAGPLGRLSANAILAGDLNAVPWSETARRVAAVGGLRPVTGVGPSWLHSAFPPALRPLAGLPIDHVMLKGAVVPRDRGTLHAVGSDHLPVLFEFGLPEDGPPVGNRP